MSNYLHLTGSWLLFEHNLAECDAACCYTNPAEELGYRHNAPVANHIFNKKSGHGNVTILTSSRQK